MTYKVMKRVIENGVLNNTLDVADTKNKLDVFFANDRLTQVQYEELFAMVVAYEETLVA